MRTSKIPGKHLKIALIKLGNMGLITVSQKDQDVQISPANERARDQMHKWADRWCDSDDECGVAKL